MSVFALAQSAADSLNFHQPVTDEVVWLRLGLAAVFGIVIGWERKMSEKPADVRTMALVSAAAAAFTLMGVQLGASVQPGMGMTLDPSRIISYIISGVGFLGGGAILHSKRVVRGLTTAASIWAAAAIGAACGLGAYVIAGGLFIITMIMLWGPWLTYRSALENGHTWQEHVQRRAAEQKEEHR
ncbi:MAG: hypothetical protein Kow0022_03340 [Phycisphaerales bacterium]